MFKSLALLPVAFTAVAVCVPQPAHAGFLDELFGGGRPEPTPYYAPPPPLGPFDYVRPRRASRPHKRVVAESKPEKQKPTDLMHDATLQNGDAVMTKEGLRVFVGDETGSHDRQDFAKLNEVSGMPKKEGQELAALDTSAAILAKGNAQPDTLASGRSAAVAVPVTEGYKITDARGRSVRYVGP